LLLHVLSFFSIAFSGFSMNLSKKLKQLTAVGIVVVSALLLLFIFFATQTALELWDRLQSAPAALFYGYLIFVGLIVGAVTWAIIKLLLPAKKRKDEAKNIDKEGILQELDDAESDGMETERLRHELDILQQRKEAGTIHIALFGDVSTGKSSIIKALLPEADIKTHIKGGSTQEITEYTWRSQSGDKLLLTDLPGRNEATGELDEMVQDEAVRSQVVIYVTDSDLTRSQFADIVTLQSYGKPLLLAINKSDRFNDEEKALIKGRIQEHFDHKLKVSFITSGGMEEVTKVYPDGREVPLIRPRKANVSPLTAHLQDEIDSQAGLLETLRDASVFVLVKNKLDDAKVDFQREKGLAIVRSSTNKAVFGAMSALSPGTDLIIQGVLGTLMVKEICKLYDVPVRQIDIDDFLKFSQGHMKSSVPLLMAVAGNGLKAFPGIGTVAGGLVHAVAYGMIFDALGRAIIKTLEQRGTLKAAPASLTFKEMLGENMDSRAKLFTKLVLDSRKDKKREK
jgi:GTP-binding protein EngB required for normal cell division/uncharacterized protein (DUF697 family)